MTRDFATNLHTHANVLLKPYGAVRHLQETLQEQSSQVWKENRSFQSSSQSCSDNLLEPLLRSDVLPDATGSPVSGTPSLLY